MEIIQYHVYMVNLDPTIGSEIKKTRPCLVISPNEMNGHLKTVMIAPMTTKSHDYPTRVALKFQNKSGWVVLDQIRTLDRGRFVKELGSVETRVIQRIKDIIREMLIE